VDLNIIGVYMFKDISEFPGYQISDSGEIFSTKTKRIIIQAFDKDGYVRTSLYRNGKRINVKAHRLVAIAFIPNPENKPIINHKDGDKTNNNVENLEWCTQSENVLHSFRVLGNTGLLGSLSPLSKSVVQIDGFGVIISRFNSIREAGRYTNIVKSTISKYCRGVGNIAGGYHWAYAI
jgi:hypothetical protein